MHFHPHVPGGFPRLAGRWARGRLSRLPPPVQAGLFATISALTFAGMSPCIRLASEQLHTFEVVFFRNFIAVLWMLPWLIRVGSRGMTTKRIGLFSVRSTVAAAGMMCGFGALTLMPMAEVTAITFSAPLFVTVGAALILGEIVRARRWTAVVIGFVGTMIVLRPGEDMLQLGAALAVGAAICTAANALILKSLSKTESAGAITVYFTLFSTPITLIPALFVWVWPSAETMFYLVLLAGLGTLGHWALAKAYAMVDLTVAMPFDFLRLPFTALFAYLLFAEIPTIWTWIGASVIFGSAFYIVRREAQLARQRRLSGA